jgi:hypothetical protein
LTAFRQDIEKQMQRFIGIFATLSALATAILVSGCMAPPRAPDGTIEQSAGDQKALVACRTRANEVYDQQNRGAIFNPMSTDRDTPRSGDYVSGIPTRGLSERYGYENMIDDCLRHTNDAAPGADTAVETIPTPPPPVDRPAPAR